MSEILMAKNMPVQIAVLRHAPTDWNQAGRIQGQTDIPLSPEGRALARRWQIPEMFRDYKWLVSPLQRTRETAFLLGAPPEIATDPRLMEMRWGAWEGCKLNDLRAKYGAQMGQWEELGLNFHAPNGESPYQVQQRLRPLLSDLEKMQTNRLIVTHKGVLRALLAYATGWEMRDSPPIKLRDGCVHLFNLSITNKLEPINMNISLDKTQDPTKDVISYGIG